MSADAWTQHQKSTHPLSIFEPQGHGKPTRFFFQPSADGANRPTSLANRFTKGAETARSYAVKNSIARRLR
jgi:hypothetical protein